MGTMVKHHLSGSLQNLYFSIDILQNLIFGHLVFCFGKCLCLELIHIMVLLKMNSGKNHTTEIYLIILHFIGWLSKGRKDWNLQLKLQQSFWRFWKNAGGTILETELDFQKLRDYYSVIYINIKVISYHERLCYVKCKGIIIHIFKNDFQLMNI